MINQLLVYCLILAVAGILLWIGGAVLQGMGERRLAKLQRRAER